MHRLPNFLSFQSFYEILFQVLDNVCDGECSVSGDVTGDETVEGPQPSTGRQTVTEERAGHRNGTLIIT